MSSQVVTLHEPPAQGFASNPPSHAPALARLVSFRQGDIPALVLPFARQFRRLYRLIRREPLLVISAGIYGSSSTWAFNAITGLLRCHSSREGCHLYADELEKSTLKRYRKSPWMVVKTHNPTPGMLATMRRAYAPAIISVRDPRDCVVSMMERFGWGFEKSLDAVAKSAALLSELIANSPAPLILNYENTNENRAAALESIKKYLALKVSPGEMASIHASLSPAAVKRQIAALEESGVFGSSAPALTWDPQTHWHPGHVGDGVSGKYLHRLTPPQAAEVWGRTRRHCQKFGLYKS